MAFPSTSVFFSSSSSASGLSAIFGAFSTLTSGYFSTLTSGYFSLGGSDLGSNPVGTGFTGVDI
jgi:hypothetical protein